MTGKQEKAGLAPRFLFVGSRLLPVALYQHPAIAAAFPVMVDPDSAGMRRMRPKAVNPDVVLAVPAVVAFDPYPPIMRWMVMMLRDGWRRRNADDNLRKCGRGSETQSEQPCQESLFHRNHKPPWFRSAGIGDYIPGDL